MFLFYILFYHNDLTQQQNTTLNKPFNQNHLHPFKVPTSSLPQPTAPVLHHQYSPPSIL
ncbi:hypothetical protein HanXRQr2_Chr17g0808281 [Helianthus annuus]|uniref:Uncharacterized protein n=1 Tax=Helianthus annuus TaxID=4232 RepID=A0A9K3GVN1_HELAN|nr:hypothetical protein HanXRQr2_Chr17g0808281 [Helianthus annuus]KAJ0429527.1 hypothetical protein HanHA300_Chr17g0658401 [Helianthus annuus]